MTTLRVVPAASSDVADIASRLNAYTPGRGTQFRAALRGALRFIRNNPRAGTPCRGGHFRKRIVSKKFQYLVIWQYSGDVVEVVNVYDARRDPSLWMDPPNGSAPLH